MAGVWVALMTMAGIAAVGMAVADTCGDDDGRRMVSLATLGIAVDHGSAQQPRRPASATGDEK